MARPVFWSTPDSYTRGWDGRPVAKTPVRIYAAQAGGSPITDLVYVDAAGVSIGAVPSGVLISDKDGLIPPFAGPDGSADVAWALVEGSARFALTADPSGTLSGSVGPGSDTWLKQNAAGFTFAFVVISTSDGTSGLPTASTIRWPDGTTGSFTGTIDSSGNGYSGYVATWAGSTTKTVTVSGISYDVNGIPIGPTGLVVT